MEPCFSFQQLIVFLSSCKEGAVYFFFKLCQCWHMEKHNLGKTRAPDCPRCDLTIEQDTQDRTGHSVVSKGQFVGLDWNPIARLHSQVMTGTSELTNSIALSH